MASDDYIRSLQNFRIKPSVQDPRLYTLDKAVRQRMKEGTRFGFDNSEVINLELEQTDDLDSSSGKILAERLAAVMESPEGPLTYEEWRRRKDAETRLRTKLMQDLEEEDKLEREKAALETRRLEELKKAQVAKWQAEKHKQEQARKSESRRREHETSIQKQEKAQKGSSAYQNWLQENLKKLQESRKRNEDLRMKSQEKAISTLRKQEERKKMIEVRYQEWLQSKMRMSTIAKAPAQKVKIKKPVMLAYSPNRPVIVSNTSVSSSYQASLGSSFIAEESEESPESSLHDLPDPLPDERQQKIFDELSSIQRTDHFLGNQVSGDSEEFIDPESDPDSRSVE